MAYIQFLSQQEQSKEDIFLRIMKSAYQIPDLDKIFYQHYSQEINLSKVYYDNGNRIEESIDFLSESITTYREYLKYPDEENPCVVLNAIEGKRLICLFSADKVRCKNLVFEFAAQYLKNYPDEYLLIDQNELYDLKRIQNLLK